MNKVIMLGRIVADPEVKDVGADNKVCNFRMAVNRRKRKDADHPEADFFNCTAWNGAAGIIGTYFHKGSQIAITGRLQNRNYEDKDGNKRTATDIIVEDFDFVDKRSASDGSGSYDVPMPTNPTHDDDDEFPM